mmetsp:Transcript_9727/g.30737  ORF Transcript_9727/g.30737 Transcript_9727/m.30737 type:complete len:216 (-) Transcript_9727:451-1098(-)
MTLTSVPCCSSTVIADAPLRRTSHTRTLESTPHDMKTPASTGDHCTSSTDPTWPSYGAASTAHPPPAEPRHAWILPAQSADASAPDATGDQSSAYPSSPCPPNVFSGSPRAEAPPPPLPGACSVRSWWERSHSRTEVSSHHVAHTWGACGISLRRFTQPGWAIVWHSMRASSSAPSSSSDSGSDSSSCFVRCIALILRHRSRFLPQASACVPATK